MSGRGAIGSALALGARGCEFESRRPDHTTLKFRMARHYFLMTFFNTSRCDTIVTNQ